MRRLMVLCIAASGLFLGWTRDGRAEEKPKAASKQIKEIGVGDDAPKLEVKEFVKGDAVDHFEKGKIYVVEFWATWCIPCRQTIPHLTELQEKYKDVIFIGVSVWEQDWSPVKPVVEKMGDKMAYRIATDAEGAMAKNWMTAAGQTGIPTAFIVNGDGKIAWIGHPADAMEESLEKICSGKWDLKEATAKFARVKQEVARRAAEKQKRQKEEIERQIAELPTSERQAVEALQKWGAKFVLKDGEIARVDFSGSEIADEQMKELPIHLRKFKDIEELHFTGCSNVTDVGLKDLLKNPEDLHDLHTLSLAGTGATDAAIKDVKRIKRLQKLGLNRTKVTDAGLKELKDLKNLQGVFVIGTKVTEAGVQALKESLPDLECRFK